MEHIIKSEIYCVGDIHGQPRAVANAVERLGLKDCALVFLGDIGLGFHGIHTGCCKFIEKNICEPFNITAYLMRGNHDNPESYNLHKEEIEKRFPHVKIMQDHDTVLTRTGKRGLVVPGSISIDRLYRIPGLSYWENELMDYSFIPEEHYDFVLAHGGPTPPVLSHHTGGLFDSMCEKDPDIKPEVDREQEYVNSVIDAATPSMWINGHYHVHEFFKHKDTMVYALDCNELMLLPEEDDY